MKAYRSVLAVAFITAPLLPANAQAQGVSVQGVGNTSCGEYQQLRARQSPAQDGVIVSWGVGLPVRLQHGGGPADYRPPPRRAQHARLHRQVLPRSAA
jgi:hypothetical protein